jgi:hypothetical protein
MRLGCGSNVQTVPPGLQNQCRPLRPQATSIEVYIFEIHFARLAPARSCLSKCPTDGSSLGTRPAGANMYAGTRICIQTASSLPQELAHNPPIDHIYIQSKPLVSSKSTGKELSGNANSLPKWIPGGVQFAIHVRFQRKRVARSRLGG